MRKSTKIYKSNEENIRNLNQFKNGITSYERCINNYDKYMEIAKETEEKISVERVGVNLSNTGNGTIKTKY